MEDACCAFKTTTCGLTYFHRRQVRGDMTDTKKKKINGIEKIHQAFPLNSRTTECSITLKGNKFRTNERNYMFTQYIMN